MSVSTGGIALQCFGKKNDSLHSLWIQTLSDKVLGSIGIGTFIHQKTWSQCLKFKLAGGFKPSEKYEFDNWDDEIPNCFWKNDSHVPNHKLVDHFLRKPSHYPIHLPLMSTND